ncbi:MAG TPA: PH domain-containing protein [Candidatus Sulfotelmatobacter sp.]|nr:PH domain-containing protein [Candidatus Sulfotelmatobacter sp.]
MSTDEKQRARSDVIWNGRPWVTPDAVFRTILIFVIAAIIIWLEFLAGFAGTLVLDISLWIWTLIVFLLIWFASLTRLLILRASHRYTLRNGSLEVKTGIVSLKSFVLSSSGFSDLEVNQSVTGRIVNYGDIIVYTQGERNTTMQKIRQPNKVTGLIRDTMGKPIFRVEGQPYSEKE